MIGAIGITAEPIDGLMKYMGWISALKAAEETEKTILVISASGGSVKDTYHIGKKLAELERERAIVIVVDDNAATRFNTNSIVRANPVIAEIKAGPQQSGKEARRKRREQERNKKLFWKI